MCHTERPDGAVVPVVDQEEITVALRDGAAMPALLARPASGTGPGVLIVPDMYGRSQFYEDLAARLADAGYLALLPEYFHRCGPLEETTVDEARARRKRLDEQQVLRDLEDALDWLADAHPGKAPVATLGFCMGGTLVLDLAATGRQLATIAYYGFPAGSGTNSLVAGPAPLDILDEIRGPILAFWGDQDAGVGLANVERFVAEMATRDIDFTSKVYPGLGHGFLATSKFDPNHAAYDAACDAWSMSVEFLGRHLGDARAA